MIEVWRFLRFLYIVHALNDERSAAEPGYYDLRECAEHVLMILDEFSISMDDWYITGEGWTTI